MQEPSNRTLFEASLSDEVNPEVYISMEYAESIFNFFKNCSLFRWSDANNDCEDRANALCMLLDGWNIPNYKGWVFSGYFLKKENGGLSNSWNYHVAAMISVKHGDEVALLIIDPATSDRLLTLPEWAANITNHPYSYHAIKTGDTYIFPSKGIKKDNWYKRNKRNYRWTMQGLSGINGVSVIGKAQLSFTKRRVKKAEETFKKLRNGKPAFLDNK